MAGTSVEQYRRQLEAQLKREEVTKAVAELRQVHPVFRKYPTLEELISLGRPGTGNYAEKDAVLAILLAEIKQETMLFPLIHLMFWESLVRIFYTKRRSVSESDQDELFSRLQVEFFHTAVAYPLERRPRKIDVNLILDTKKKITRWQREEALYRERHEEFGPAHEERPALADLQRSEVFPEELEACLLDLVYRKVINERQYDLLLETEVYKRMTEKEWAAARGVAYATARSWHYRAVTAIRKYAKARREQEEAE